MQQTSRALLLALIFGAQCIFLIKANCEVPDIQHGRLYSGKKRLEAGDTVPSRHIVRVSCSPGFRTTGATKSFIRCLSGKWEPRIPDCDPIPCPPPPKLENGFVLENDVDEGFLHVGSVVTYECRPSHELFGDSALVCELEGKELKWKGVMPVCERTHYDCEDPGTPLSTIRKGRCCEHGSVLTFECDEKELFIEGPNVIFCNNGTWNDTTPTCTGEICCPQPPKIENGKIISKRRACYLPWDDVEIECDPGFTLSADMSSTIYCEDNGEWDQEFPRCIAPDCELPGLPGNGTMIELDAIGNATSLPYGFEVNYKCNPGFRLIGTSFSKCSAFGWTAQVPVCEWIQCPDPGNLENGWRIGDSFQVGDTVTYGCFSGYYLLGSLKSRCLPNGQWSGERARCTALNDYCPNPGTPINGNKIGISYQLGDTVKFQCFPGYFLLGSEERVCQRNKEWNGTQPKCIGAGDFDTKSSLALRFQETLLNIAEEDLSDDDRRNRFTNSTEYHDDRIRLLDLNYGGMTVVYFVFDTSKSVGIRNFNISIQFAKAFVRFIGEERIRANKVKIGAVTFSTEVAEEFSPLGYDNMERIINALDNIVYEEGGTAIAKALRSIRKTMIPYVKRADEFKYMSKKFVVFLLTDGKPNMAGDPNDEADELKKQDVDIYSLGITGSPDKDILYKIASDPHEDFVFILDSYETMSDIVEALVNGTESSYARCGIRVAPPRSKRSIDDRARIIKGKSVEKPWSWIAALVKEGKDEIFCGGSLIDNDWILTAAHCLYEKKPGDFNIKLGFTDHSNSSHAEVYDPDRIFIHQSYSNVTFDYDIALIKLQRPVRYSKYIRPICLPPSTKNIAEDSLIYKEGEDAVIIGWGYAKEKEYGQKVEATDHEKMLRYARIPLQPRDVCSEFIERTRALPFPGLKNIEFTDTMFCAGSGTGDADACQGDSGGPIMQELSESQWTQIGIISWGVGCGKAGRYGIFTWLSQVRDWIDITMRTNNI